MTISWSKIPTKLPWTTSSNGPAARRRALTSIVIAPLLGVASHAVVANPWSDHGPLAHTIAREAACAGAEKLLLGGTPLEIEWAAIDRLVTGGFRKVHGYEVLVSHRSSDQGRISADFSVAVSIVHQDKHYLLEELIDYRPSWAVQSVFVDEVNFDQCTRDRLEA